MDEQSMQTQESYDRVAAAYSKQIGGELQHKPLEREMLARFAEEVEGRICDLGCGPGHVAAYLAEHGADAFGIDLSPGMIEQARKNNPGIPFEVGNMRNLRLDDESLGGIVALYSIIHINREDVTAVLGEMRRVLRSGGRLLIGFHKGTEVLRREELWDQPVTLDYFFFQPGEMVKYLKEADFVIDDVIERAPYPDVEYQSHRVYIQAHKPT
jgi:ubiquinone/menaquinone biosynthesis C-methylase UbiE